LRAVPDDASRETLGMIPALAARSVGNEYDLASSSWHT
jgi:hypothetical protein